ncbi:MAG: tetratricopeptide repeat protein [Gammaproteobacteria bacterium]|nr:tetratricopeptide repeat protein [Gammaproteobacteria bacterium]
MITVRIQVLAPTLLLLLSSTAHAVDSPQLAQANTLLAQHRPVQALALLEETMAADAGDPQYDRLLGQAALAANKPNLAVFALERVVLTQPDDTDARLALVRAYIELGEFRQAKTELTQLPVSRDPSLYHIAQQYMRQINYGIRQQQRDFALVVSMGAGRDSNANSATDIDQFLGANLSTNSQATASDTSSLLLSAAAALPLSKKWRNETSAQFFHQEFSDASFVNTDSVSLTNSLNYQSSRRSQEQWVLQAMHTEVDQQLNNRQASVQFNHAYTLDTGSLTLTVKTGQTRYDDKYAIRNIQQHSGGLRYAYQLGSLSGNVALLTGQDRPIDNQSPYSRQFNAAQLGFMWNQGKTNTIASINYVQSVYDSTFFGIDRNDNNVGASLRLNYKLGAKWTAGPSLTIMRNQSSVDLYDYDRNQAMVFISHQII